MAINPLAVGAATGIAGLTLGAAGGLFGGNRSSAPDISGELAKIRALFDAQLASAKASNAETARQQGTQARNNLAGRGTYRSPVAEHVFGEIRRNQSSADAQAAGQLAGAEAQMRGSLLAQLLGYDQQQRQLQGQQRAALFGQGGSLLSSLLLASILRNPASTADAAAPGNFAGSLNFSGQSPNFAGSTGYGDRNSGDYLSALLMRGIGNTR